MSALNASVLKPWVYATKKGDTVSAALVEA